MTALTNAFNETDRMLQRAKAKQGTDVGAQLTGGSMALSRRSISLDKAAEQYRHFRGWAYVAIKAIASRIAGQDCFVGREVKAPKRKHLGSAVEPLDTHPLLDAINSPNPLMTRWPLLFSTVASLLLTGRSHWWITDDLQVWPLPSHWIEPKDSLRNTWLLKPWGSATNATELPHEAIASFVMPNPADPFGSLSPLQAQALAVSTDEQIQATQHDSFARGLTPQLAFRVGRLPGMEPGVAGERPVLTDEQRVELVDVVKRLYSGTAGRNHPLILDGMIEGVDRIAQNAEEMGFLDSGKMTKARIFQAFGVNPIVAGEVQDANKAQSVVAEQHFCSNTVNPLIELLSQSLTRWIAGRFPGENLKAWIEPAKANDAEQKLAEYKAGRSNGDITTNEFRRNILNLPDLPGGDVLRDSLGNEIKEPTFRLNGAVR